MKSIKAVPITPAKYKIYGDVISAREGLPFVSANLGTAKRFNWLADLRNLRPRKAKPNLCLFRSRPFRKKIFEIRILERHQFSTQVFIPTGKADRYLAIVSRGGSKPELKTLAAFIVSGDTGISYKPGVWHHPIIALGKVTDFVCLVWEDRSKDDCHVVKIGTVVPVKLL